MSHKAAHSSYELYEISYASGAPELGDADDAATSRFAFDALEDEFFETAQERTDNDEFAYLQDDLGGTRATSTIQAVAGRASRWLALVR